MYELVYTSLLSAGTDARALPAILDAARARNAGCDVTGILLFDGRRFVGYLEGSEQAVGGISVLIAADMRHHAYEVRHESALAPPRRFDGCALAYAQLAPGAADPLAQPGTVAIVDRLLALLPGLHLQRG